MAKNVVKCVVGLVLSVAVLFGSVGAVGDFGSYEVIRPFDIDKEFED